MTVDGPWERMDVKEAGRAWLAFIGPDACFPREIMTPSYSKLGGRKQHDVSNSVQYVDVLSKHAHRGDVWVSQRPTTQFDQAVHTHFWADVDAAGDIPAAMRRRDVIENFARGSFGSGLYWQFSGSKGFHGHVEHAPVYATSDQYRSAIKKLLRECGIDPLVIDLNVVGKYRAMPRPPFTGNTNAVEYHGEFLYTVPVDESESAESILAESRSPTARRVSIPFAPHAAKLIQEIVDELPRPRPMKTNLPDSPSKRRVDDTISFVRKVAPNVRDGHKRFLRLLVIPAFLHSTNGDEAATREAAKEFVEASGAPWAKYRPYVDAQFKTMRFADGHLMWPMRINKFYIENPDILRANSKR